MFRHTKQLSPAPFDKLRTNGSKVRSIFWILFFGRRAKNNIQGVNTH